MFSLPIRMGHINEVNFEFTVRFIVISPQLGYFRLAAYETKHGQALQDSPHLFDMFPTTDPNTCILHCF